LYIDFLSLLKKIHNPERLKIYKDVSSKLIKKYIGTPVTITNVRNQIGLERKPNFAYSKFLLQKSFCMHPKKLHNTRTYPQGTTGK